MNMAAPEPVAFPWGSLEVTSRADVAALRDARRWAAHQLRADAFARALEGLLGADVRLVVARAVGVRARAHVRPLEGGLAVLVARDEDEALTDAALLEVEPALASAVVARVLRRPPPGAVNAEAPPSPAIAGALAAVVVAAARRAQAAADPSGSPGLLRVVSAGDAAQLETDFLRGLSHGGSDAGATRVTLALTVLVGDDAYSARLILSRAFAAPAPPWTSRSLSMLGAVPLSLPIVACATRASVGEVASLRAGDAWVPGHWPLELAGDGSAGRSLRGPVVLAAPAASIGARATLVEGGRLVLSGEADAIDGASRGAGRSNVGASDGAGEGPTVGVEADMTELDGESALLESVGDVLVTVRVEIGEARMPARDWAALGRGDVITLGRRLGDPVLLRVGGVPIARGELVNVDGEVGVRIAERLGGDATRA
jgi:flagellar motor switch/type III secretory pathway protein FliN